MNRHPAGSTEPDAAAVIDLACVEPFPLGHLIATPAALIVEGSGWSQRLEPRAMQVLVALARAAPAVLGRGQLNAEVWGGRIVGDDAINRAVQVLRRLAASAPPPMPFSIETVPRVGYRLAAEAPIGVAVPPDETVRGRRRPAMAEVVRPWLIAAATLMLALIAGITARRAMAPDTGSPDAWRVAGAVVLDDLLPSGRDAVLSPDGRRLAYRGQDTHGRSRLFIRTVANAGAGDPVSPPALDARCPAWSHDGAALAFCAYDAGAPCRLYVVRANRPPAAIGSCETEREPHISWSTDGRYILFGDKPGQNAVLRISAIRIADGHRDVLSSPPGGIVGDTMPLAIGGDIVFQRQFGWADTGWLARDPATGRERLLWRQGDVTGSVAAALPGGTLAVAWTRAGASHLDLVDAGGRAGSLPAALGPVASLSAGGPRLLVETDRGESALVHATGQERDPPLVTMRGRITSPVLLPDGRIRFAVTSAGATHLWERDGAGSIRPWGSSMAATIAGLALSPDGRMTAALWIGAAGSEIVLLNDKGRVSYRWNGRARKLNPAAWSGDGRKLIVPVLDNTGWRLFTLDPFGGVAPRDLGLPGFAVVQSHGATLYAVRAGETTGTRELWRLDGPPRRLPFDLTLFDIVNWSPTGAGVWLPDRSDQAHPRLVLRSAETGLILRSVNVPSLAGAGSRLAADLAGPLYVRDTSDAFEHVLLTLATVPKAP